MYSKTNDFGNNRIINYINNQINSGNLLDANKEKAPTWFTSKGLQLPELVQTIIGTNNIIPENSEKVNTSDEKNSKLGAAAAPTVPLKDKDGGHVVHHEIEEHEPKKKTAHLIKVCRIFLNSNGSKAIIVKAKKQLMKRHQLLLSVFRRTRKKQYI